MWHPTQVSSPCLCPWAGQWPPQMAAFYRPKPSWAHADGPVTPTLLPQCHPTAVLCKGQSWGQHCLHSMATAQITFPGHSLLNSIPLQLPVCLCFLIGGVVVNGTRDHSLEAMPKDSASVPATPSRTPQPSSLSSGEGECLSEPLTMLSPLLLVSVATLTTAVPFLCILLQHLGHSLHSLISESSGSSTQQLKIKWVWRTFPRPL